MMHLFDAMSRPLEAVEAVASVPCSASLPLGSREESPYERKEQIMRAFFLCFVWVFASSREGQQQTDELRDHQVSAQRMIMDFRKLNVTRTLDVQLVSYSNSPN